MADSIVDSPYQEAYYDALVNTDSHIIINAVAGSGKTTTIVRGLKKLPTDTSAAFFAFNKVIADELKNRVPKWVHASTLHSFGCRMLMMHFGTLKIDENKVYGIALKLYSKFAPESQENKNTFCYRVARIVDVVRLTMFDIDDKEGVLFLALRFGIEVFENEIEAAKLVLEASNKASTEVIDFTDMIYQCAVRNIKLRKYKYVFVDEVQDLNKAQQTMLKKVVHPNGGRLICVGDPRQSIYGFAGADLESYNNMKTLFANTIELPLSICYRCPIEVVELAQTIVGEIKPNPKGIHSKPRDGSHEELKPGDWVLCRMTKPLVMLFVKLVADHKKAYIKGREIGKNLINLIKRTKQPTVSGLLKKLNEDRIELKIKLIKKRVFRPDMSSKMVEFDEKFKVIKILSKGILSTTELITKIDGIFLDTATDAIVLSTVHKAKGSEAPRIFLLAKELIPSPYAKTPEDFLQEENLLYVAYTRAQKQLIFIKDFNLEEQRKLMDDIVE